MKHPKGYILYEGPSLLDDEPIVVIATFDSKNDKTGNLIQTWILHRNLRPSDAAKQGLDSSVCGDCPHRRTAQNSCYVNLAFAPNGVWKAYQRGVYPRITDYTAFTGRQVRLGSYGDPAAAPTVVWEALISQAAGHTGYTHQWRRAELQHLCMASCETASERLLAKNRGYRTYRVTTENEKREQSEALCPASSAAPSVDLIQCADCMACCGQNRGLRGDIAIPIHGAAYVQKGYLKLRATYQPIEIHAHA